MRKILIILSFALFLFLTFKSLQGLQDISRLDQENLGLDQEIKSFKVNLKQLEGVFDDPIELITDNYADLNEQLKKFSRLNGLNALLDLKSLGKEGSIEEAADKAPLPGIKMAKINIDFYKVKSMEQVITVLKFLEIIEANYPLKILMIRQKNDLLAVETQLYGRGL
jgi:hypothetical protein